MDKIFVIPAKQGSKVYDPIACDFIPEKGREVINSIYWLRRIRDGDVTVGEPQSEPRNKPKRRGRFTSRSEE